MSLLSPNLLAFEAIVKCQTVHAAADDIGLTQTGVTQRIRVLEQELCATLFLRSRKGMLLTPEGEALHRYCKAALDLEGAALGYINGPGNDLETQISLVGPTSILRSRVVPQCLKLLDRFPKLLFSITTNDRAERIERLRSGKSQLAIVSPELVAKEMDSKVLKPEKFILVGPNKWKNRRIKDIVSQERIVDFDMTDDSTYNYLKTFDLIEKKTESRHFVNENDSLIYLLSEGVGYGTLAVEIAAPYLRRGQLSVLNGGKSYVQNHALAWYPRLHMADYFRVVIQSIE